MNQLKFLTILSIMSVMLIGFSLKAYAQPGNMPTVDEIVSKMQTKLNLTDEQITRIYPIIEEQVEKRDPFLDRQKAREEVPCVPCEAKWRKSTKKKRGNCRFRNERTKI